MHRTRLSGKLNAALESAALGESISTEGLLSGLLRKILGKKDEGGQVKVEYDTQFVYEAKEFFSKTYLNPEWLDAKTEVKGTADVNATALTVNGKVPSDVAGALITFLNDFMAYRKKYYPHLLKYGQTLSQILKETLKHKVAKEAFAYAKPQVLKAREELCKHAPTFPLMGLTLDSKGHNVKAADKKSAVKITTWTKAQIKEVCELIVKFIDDTDNWLDYQEKVWDASPNDFESLFEDEFSKFHDEDEDLAMQLASIFDTSNEFPGDFVGDIENGLGKTFVAIDTLMTKSLK